MAQLLMTHHAKSIYGSTINKQVITKVVAHQRTLQSNKITMPHIQQHFISHKNGPSLLHQKTMKKSGLCFWSYRVWYGALWNYSEWGEKMAFILRDQYGNEATIIAKVGNDEHIKFYVS